MKSKNLIKIVLLLFITNVANSQDTNTKNNQVIKTISGLITVNEEVVSGVTVRLKDYPSIVCKTNEGGYFSLKNPKGYYKPGDDCQIFCFYPDYNKEPMKPLPLLGKGGSLGILKLEKRKIKGVDIFIQDEQGRYLEGVEVQLGHGGDTVKSDRTGHVFYEISEGDKDKFYLKFFHKDYESKIHKEYKPEVPPIILKRKGSRTNHSLKPQDIHNNKITAIHFIKDENYIISADKGGYLKLWSKDGNLLDNRQAHKSEITILSKLSPTQFFSLSKNGTINTWKIEKIKAKNSEQEYPQLQLISNAFQGKNLSDRPTAIAVSPNSKWIAIGDIAGNITLYSADGRLLNTFHRQYYHNITSVGFLPNNPNILAFSTLNGYIIFLKIEEKKGNTKLLVERNVYANDKDEIHQIEFNKRGNKFCSIHKNGQLKVWRVKKGKPKVQKKHDLSKVKQVHQIIFKTNDLIGLNLGKKIEFWNIEHYKPYDSIEFKNEISTLLFIPESQSFIGAINRTPFIGEIGIQNKVLLGQDVDPIESIKIMDNIFVWGKDNVKHQMDINNDKLYTTESKYQLNQHNLAKQYDWSVNKKNYALTVKGSLIEVVPKLDNQRSRTTKKLTFFTINQGKAYIAMVYDGNKDKYYFDSNEQDINIIKDYLLPITKNQVDIKHQKEVGLIKRFFKEK